MKSELGETLLSDFLEKTITYMQPCINYNKNYNNSFGEDSFSVI